MRIESCHAPNRRTRRGGYVWLPNVNFEHPESGGGLGLVNKKTGFTRYLQRHGFRPRKAFGLCEGGLGGQLAGMC